MGRETNISNAQELLAGIGEGKDPDASCVIPKDMRKHRHIF